VIAGELVALDDQLASWRRLIRLNCSTTSESLVPSKIRRRRRCV
jgi:hypothetical protein